MKISAPERETTAAPVSMARERVSIELASCEVRLGGDVRNSVPKYNVTAPEVMVLRAVHGGNEAVISVKKTGERKVSVMQEKARLIATYGQREDQAKLLEGLFPGMRPVFPLTIAEVEDFARAADEDDEAVSAAEETLLS